MERKEDAALYKNNEISSLIVALGLGVKGEATTANLRYGKVCGDMVHVVLGACCIGCVLYWVCVVWWQGCWCGLLGVGGLYIGMNGTHTLHLPHTHTYTHTPQPLRSYC